MKTFIAKTIQKMRNFSSSSNSTKIANVSRGWANFMG